MAERPRPPDLDIIREEYGKNELSSGKGYARSSSPNWQSVKKNAQRKFISTVERILSISRGDIQSVSQNLQFDPTELPVVQLGPVIGKVTKDSARILLEINKRGIVAMVLEEVDQKRSETLERSETNPQMPKIGYRGNKKTNGQSQSLMVERLLNAGRPAIFVFNNLRPGTRYRIKLKKCEGRQSSSFCTVPAEIPASVNFAVISCNKIFITEKEIPAHSDLWAHLAKAVESRKIDMCLHLGDQIYGDGDKLLDAEAGEAPGDWSDCFRKSKAVLLNVAKGHWEDHYEAICESYREVYRKTWSHSYTAYCLANCPNLMIYDDHEVRDNWADVPGDWDKESVDFYIARCAWRVNLEYQRQLHEDVDFTKMDDIEKDYHFHLISGVGIMFIDVRGSRTFHRATDDPLKYLGTRQWEDIEKALNAGGIFATARVLLLCTPAPLVFLERNFTNAVANRVQKLEDFKGHWSAAPHFAEQKKMVECLCNWKKVSSERDLLVLGGDVHCGGHSEVFKDRKVVFRQLTTSAIANHALPKSAYYMLRAAGRVSGVGQNFTFRHHDWTRSRNYGLVHVRDRNGPQANMMPEVTSQLIKGKFMIGFREGVKVSNLQESTPPSCRGCFGFLR